MFKMGGFYRTAPNPSARDPQARLVQRVIDSI